jgi:2'-5' RNA ligase
MNKRLFFGFPAVALWPAKLPAGRLIAPGMRHFTAAFLGDVAFDTLETHLPNIPLPPFKVGFTGFFDQCLFLPERHPHVVAWHGNTHRRELCEEYVIRLAQWLEGIGYPLNLRLPWLPHATLARSPFDPKEWRKAFTPTPFFVSHFALYESFPGLEYRPIWNHSFTLPFEEIEHTADRAYIIRGEAVEDLYHNACCALAFVHPPLMVFAQNPPTGIDELVSSLNRVLGLADAEQGCPFKAVSYHGDIKQREAIYEWEMIVDV